MIRITLLFTIFGLLALNTVKAEDPKQGPSNPFSPFKKLGDKAAQEQKRTVADQLSPKRREKTNGSTSILLTPKQKKLLHKKIEALQEQLSPFQDQIKQLSAYQLAQVSLESKEPQNVEIVQMASTMQKDIENNPSQKKMLELLREQTNNKQDANSIDPKKELEIGNAIANAEAEAIKIINRHVYSCLSKCLGRKIEEMEISPEGMQELVKENKECVKCFLAVQVFGVVTELKNETEG